eukprot:gene6844-biopygen9252
MGSPAWRLDGGTRHATGMTKGRRTPEKGRDPIPSLDRPVDRAGTGNPLRRKAPWMGKRRRRRAARGNAVPRRRHADGHAAAAGAARGVVWDRAQLITSAARGRCGRPLRGVVPTPSLPLLGSNA